MMELIERFFSTMERIAVSLEVLANRPAVKVSPGLGVAPEDNDDSGEAEGEMSREELKKALHEMGVDFPPSTRTTTLARLYEESQRNTGDDAPPQDDGQDSGEEKPTAEVTKGQVRDALVALSAARGKEAGVDVMEKVSGLRKLSDIDEKHYPAILKACQEALA